MQKQKVKMESCFGNSKMLPEFHSVYLWEQDIKLYILKDKQHDCALVKLRFVSVRTVYYL